MLIDGIWWSTSSRDQHLDNIIKLQKTETTNFHQHLLDNIFSTTSFRHLFAINISTTSSNSRKQKQHLLDIITTTSRQHHMIININQQTPENRNNIFSTSSRDHQTPENRNNKLLWNMKNTSSRIFHLCPISIILYHTFNSDPHTFFAFPHTFSCSMRKRHLEYGKILQRLPESARKLAGS